MSKSANYPKFPPVFYQNFKAGGRLDPRIALIRNTPLPFYGINGVATAAAHTPRIEYDPTTKECLGLLVEGWKANLLLNSAVAATQTVSIASGLHYSISWEGSGTVSVVGTVTYPYSGTTFDGRNVYTFRAAETSITLVPSGDVRKWQLEEHPSPTRYLETNSSSVTAYGDIVRLNIASMLPLRSSFTVVGQVRIVRAPRGANNRTYFQLRCDELSLPYIQSYGDRGAADSNSILPSDFFYASAGEYIFSGGIGNRAINMSTRVPVRTAFSVSYETDSIICACNGVQVTSVIKPIPQGFQGFNQISIGNGSTANTRPGLNGHVEELALYDRAVTLTELLQLTK